ncbi:growth hormone receptor a isoform 1-T1 [Synchiropus picturatus]
MPVSLHCFLLMVLMSSLSTPGAAFLRDWDHMTTPDPLEPHFTECVSRNQETFRCWWSPGSLQNLSSLEDLKVYYFKKDSSSSIEWKECPDYSPTQRECYFDSNHTSIWVPYCLQLRGQNVTYFNEEDCFTVENIVRPDPPVSLNWTQLNMSPSGRSSDVMVSWEAPPSADVKAGWIRLQYELQYREKNSPNWKALEIQPHTHQPIYGLRVGTEYEVHVRSRMHAFVKFGDFSESIFIEVSDSFGKESTYSFTLILIFGLVVILVLIMLIAVSQQHRLMMVLLPPVPAPKIKGIDSEMLKKGKLEELNLILSGGGMGGLSTYTPDFYQDEPWVEFIEVDLDDPEALEKESTGSDTQKLLGLSQPVGHHNHAGCSNSSSFPSTDSGRASCYDPDLPDQDTLMLMATLLPGQAEERESTSDPTYEQDRNENQTPPGPQTWVNTDFYAQVSNVMPSGGVVLSPGQQQKIQENTVTTGEGEEKIKKRCQEMEGENDPSALQFHLLVVDPEGSGYTSESNAEQVINSQSPTTPHTGYQSIPPAESPAEEHQSPYIPPDSPQLIAPVADYTVVQEVDSQNSLLLNPPPIQAPPLCLPQQPIKAVPVMPVGYVTPELFGNLSP